MKSAVLMALVKFGPSLVLRLDHRFKELLQLAI